MTSKPYKLYYWPIPGLGEASRVALTLAKLEWEDIAIDGKMFADMKGDGTLPWGMIDFSCIFDAGPPTCCNNLSFAKLCLVNSHFRFVHCV